MTPDHELLSLYAEKHDEAAFAEVVRRHLNWVYALALRSVNGNAALAEDVTQAVFTDLARKAGPLRNHVTVAGWLHTSVRFAAAKAMRDDACRRTREQEASAMNETTAPAPTMDTAPAALRPLLDEAVGQLREPERDAVLLRFFEEKSYREVGDLLGRSENAARMRVERALDKLRAQFSRCGVATTAALLASALGAHGATTLPPAGFAGTVPEKSIAGALHKESDESIISPTDLFAKLAGHRLAVLALGAGIAVLIFIWSSRPSVPASKAATNPVQAPKLAVIAPLAAPVPASDRTTKVPPKNDLGKIYIDDENATLDKNGYQTFALASGRLFKISDFENNSDGTISIAYGVRAPEKADQRILNFKPVATMMEIDSVYIDTVTPGTPIIISTADGEPVSFIPLAQPLDINRIGKVYVGDAVPHPVTLHSGKVFALLYTKYNDGGKSERTPGYVRYFMYDSMEAYQAQHFTEGGGLGGMPAAGRSWSSRYHRPTKW